MYKYLDNYKHRKLLLIIKISSKKMYICYKFKIYDIRTGLTERKL